MRKLDAVRAGKPVNPGKPEGVLGNLMTSIATIHVELITPLFGGGVQARVVDEKHWLRSSEVKTGMRMWWRLQHGRSFEKLQDMWQEESRLFGRASKIEGNLGVQVGGCGVFSLAVDTQRVQAKLAAKQYAKPNTSESVAYFPAAMDDGSYLLDLDKTSEARTTAVLTLAWRRPGLASEKDKAHLLQALSAFLVFGGVGSRTRKGAGALAPCTVADGKALEYYPMRGVQDLGNLRPAGTTNGKVPTTATFFGGHGPLTLLAAPNRSHKHLLAAWKEVRKAARSLTIQASPLNPRRVLGLPLSTKGSKGGGAQERLASPVWGGVARIWPSYNPDAAVDQGPLAPSTMAVFLVGDPAPSGPVPVTSAGDLDCIRKCILDTLNTNSFNQVWSI